MQLAPPPLATVQPRTTENGTLTVIDFHYLLALYSRAIDVQVARDPYEAEAVYQTRLRSAAQAAQARALQEFFGQGPLTVRLVTGAPGYDPDAEQVTLSLYETLRGIPDVTVNLTPLGGPPQDGRTARLVPATPETPDATVRGYVQIAVPLARAEARRLGVATRTATLSFRLNVAPVIDGPLSITLEALTIVFGGGPTWQWTVARRARDVGFAFHNRTFTCPTPAHGVAQRQDAFTVTFHPDGSYATSSPDLEGTSVEYVRAGRALVSRCHAEPLPADVTQEDQSITAVFRFGDGSSHQDVTGEYDTFGEHAYHQIEREAEPSFVAIYDFCEVAPEIIGGTAALQSGIVYPDADKRAGTQGTVVVRFIVTPEGRTADIEVVRGVSPGLDREAMRAVERARFTPGRQNGQPVAARQTRPVTFRLP